MNEIRNEALTKFLNAAFNSIDNDLLTIPSLSDPELVETILLDIDDKFFQNIGLLPPDSETNRIYNMGLILTRIENYYQYIIKSPIQEDFFIIKDRSYQNLLHLAQLITGITAQCQKREEYLNIMNSLPENISNELMKILFELIPVDEAHSEKSMEKDNKSEEDEDKANENAMLWIRAENAEKECERLNEEMNKMSNKIADLTQSNYSYEISLKETEAKYQELVSIVGKREYENQTDSNQNYIEQVTLSIQLSELKGKLNAKEKNFIKYREEKEKIITDLKDSNFNLKKENLTLKESSVKFEVLKEQMKKFSMEEMHVLKQKVIQNEKIIKEKENEIKKLKNYDSDKTILLKKIEELNYELSIEKEKENQLLKENEEYRFNIVSLEKENDGYRLKKSLQTTLHPFDSSHINSTISDTNKGENNRYSNASKQNEERRISFRLNDSSTLISMQKIDEDEAQKMRLVELETKVKLLQSEKELLSKDKITQSESITQNNALIKEQKEQLDKLSKKLEKYSQFKKENQTFISKITDLMDKVEDAKNENLKLKNMKVEIENSYNGQLIAANKTISELKMRIKELESQITLLRNEISKYEEHEKSNKEYIDQLKKKTIYPGTDVKVVEMEKKLKEMTENENNDLKKKCKEKDEIISKQKEKIVKVDNDMKELALKIERLPTEISKRDEAIEYYKNQLEQKEKMHNDEMRIIAGLYHSLSYQCINLKNKNKDNDMDRDRDRDKERNNVHIPLNTIR